MTITRETIIFFATFSHYDNKKRLPTNGFIESILSYFLPKVNTFILLDGPHPVSDSVNPIIEIFKKGKLNKRWEFNSWLYLPIYLMCKLPSVNPTRISYKLRDFYVTIFIGLFKRKKYDLFIGVESIYALAGIFLKKIGIVKRVVYYVSDYSPTRYGSTLFNKAYVWLDIFCVKHTDYIWDVSPYMATGRLEAGLNKRYLNKIIHVPNGLFPSQIRSLPITKRIKNSIVYMGILNKDKGFDIILNIFALVLKSVPDATFHIVGGTKEHISYFKQETKKLGIENNCVFYGFVSVGKPMTHIIQKCMLGIAAYTTNSAPENKYGDSGKIKQYLGCGLPIIATDIQWYTKQVIEEGAGIRANQKPEDFVKAVLKLFRNKKLYRRYSKKAELLGRNNTWEKSYEIALENMQN